MLKKFTLALLCWLGGTILCSAQLDSVDIHDLKGKIHHYYSQLNRTDMSTNVLYDRTMPFSSISYFDGVYDTAINYNNWFQVFMELRNACYDTTLLPSIGIIRENAWSKVLHDTIPIGLLFFDYDKLKYYAEESNLINFNTTNEYFTDVSNPNCWRQSER